MRVLALVQAAERLAMLVLEPVLAQAPELELVREQRAVLAQAAVRLPEALGPEPERAPVARAPTMTMHLLELVRAPEPERAPEVDAADAGTAMAITAARLPTTSRLCCRRCRAATALR